MIDLHPSTDYSFTIRVILLRALERLVDMLFRRGTLDPPLTERMYVKSNMDMIHVACDDANQ